MLTAKEIGHASCFFALEARRYVGVRGRPELPTRTAEPVESVRHLRRAGATTNAPEGGGTTQSGDPAPGPMRCGNHRIR